MRAGFPIVERPDQVDAVRVGTPNGEPGSVHIVEARRVSAEESVGAGMRAFGMQVNIEIRKLRVQTVLVFR